jgi:Tol biopolymer transport system component
VTDLRARLQAALGPGYRVEHELGGGGMSRVFLAQEHELGRQVVVKVLPPEMAAGVNGERFRREIRLAASLQHPHIVPLLAAGHADDLVYYTMPLIDGESLRAKLAREGELPVPETVRLLRDVTDALAYAHEHGVAHRDIKPDNVLIARHHAVVTDFGVAKALSESTGKSALTSAGVALGTPAYMAPEQAVADPHTDHRCDIYAVGAVGYEMLTGRPPFMGPTPQHVMAAQVTEAPEPVTRRRATVPAALAALVMRCLEKSPADRWQSAEELLDQLEAMATPSGGSTPTGTHPVATVARAPQWLKLALGTTGLVIVVAGTAVLARSKSEVLTLGTVTQITFEPGLEIEPAISPDGKLVAYTAGPMSAARIYVRQSGGRPVALTADSGPPQRRPLWSPDGTRILFETDADLLVMPALGGTPRIMAHRACCAAWSPDGRQVAYARSRRRLGGSPERPESIYVTPPDGGPSRFIGLVFDPHSLTWSPDGQWLALVSGNDQFALGAATLGNKGPSAIVLVPAVGGAPVPVTDNAALNVSPAWTPDGRHLLFVSNRDGARDVYVVRLGSAGMPGGRPSRLTTGLNAHSISLSADGTRLAYSVYTSHANVWAISIPTDGPISADRATQVTTGNQTVEGLTVSPDGRWLYFDSDRSGNANIYRMPLGGGEPERLTTNPADDFSPDVSPNGRWVAFHSLRFGTRDIFVMPADGGEAQRVTDDPGEERFPIWSPDGQSLSYSLNGTGTRDGLYVISKDQSGRWGPPRRVWNHPARGAWSRDGRTLLSIWTDGIWLIPAAGGASRRVYEPPDTVNGPEPPVSWSADGRAIYFKEVDREGRASFWALPTTGGRPRLLVRFDDPTKPFYHPNWKAHGRRFYFTINDRQSDIYVAELHNLR